ncbi:hypothetical protein X759_31020 [Mesorhizobium sp. LSHC420B00]|nr:hypothetical protein X759_31020 [Mesorhizobium sp. LSHC420B00]
MPDSLTIAEGAAVVGKSMVLACQFYDRRLAAEPTMLFVRFVPNQE